MDGRGQSSPTRPRQRRSASPGMAAPWPRHSKAQYRAQHTDLRCSNRCPKHNECDERELTPWYDAKSLAHGEQRIFLNGDKFVGSLVLIPPDEPGYTNSKLARNGGSGEVVPRCRVVGNGASALSHPLTRQHSIGRSRVDRGGLEHPMRPYRPGRAVRNQVTDPRDQGVAPPSSRGLLEFRRASAHGERGWCWHGGPTRQRTRSMAQFRGALNPWARMTVNPPGEWWTPVWAARWERDGPTTKKWAHTGISFSFYFSFYFPFSLFTIQIWIWLRSSPLIKNVLIHTLVEGNYIPIHIFILSHLNL
jgi:hypothetical protein